MRCCPFQIIFYSCNSIEIFFLGNLVTLFKVRNSSRSWKSGGIHQWTIPQQVEGLR